MILCDIFMDSSTFLWALGICVTIISGLVAFVVKMVLDSHDKTINRITGDLTSLSNKLKEQDEEVDGIKYNYLDRFAKIHADVLTTKQEIIDRLNNFTK